jgi:MFS family permease
MASSTVAMFIGTLISGWAVIRYGPLRVIIAAMICTSVALLSFEWTTDHAVPAILSRLLQGTGFGLFMTAGISYVQSKTPEANQQYAIGLFSAMAIAPYFFAQFEAEWYLRTFGAGGIFAIGAAPFVFALAWALRLLPREKPVKGKPKGASYRTVLSTPQIYPPYFCMTLNGMLFGFGASFIPIMLADSAILVGWYFTPFAIMTLGTRFFLVKHLQKLPKAVLLTLGMVAFGFGALCPLVSMTTISIVLSGALYGFGYAFVGPNVIVSVGQFFTPAERPRAVALTQTFFQGGSVLAPIIAGYAISALGKIGLPLFMAAIGFGAITMAALVLMLSTGPATAREGV